MRRNLCGQPPVQYRTCERQPTDAHNLCHSRKRRLGRDNLIAAARKMTGPLSTKPNRGGKGLGVLLFQDVGALAAHVDSDAFEDSVDGITLIQQYIAAPEPYITRVEFVGGKFLYAV